MKKNKIQELPPSNLTEEVRGLLECYTKGTTAIKLQEKIFAVIDSRIERKINRIDKNF